MSRTAKTTLVRSDATIIMIDFDRLHIDETTNQTLNQNNRSISKCKTLPYQTTNEYRDINSPAEKPNSSAGRKDT